MSTMHTTALGWRPAALRPMRRAVRTWRAIAERMRRRREVAELMAMGDRELKDLGLSRADVYGIAQGRTVERGFGLPR